MKSFIFFTLTLLLLSACSNGGPGKYDSLAKCLTEKDAKMYGTDWCPHCQNQKKEFGKSFQYINYINCDERKDECIIAGVKGYPTWMISGQNYPGEQSLNRLSQLSDCSITS